MSALPSPAEPAPRALGAAALGMPASIALYLGVVVGSGVVGARALAAGWNAGVVSGALFFALCALFFGLERWRPWRRRWLSGWSDLRVDLPLLLLAAPVGALVVAPLVALAGRVARAADAGLWPAHWPLLGQAALALVLGDFVRYWFHRAEHAWLPLWRIHATHHSAERLYFLNGPRLHPLEIALSGALQTAPLVALGASEQALALQVCLTVAIGRFQHGNLALTLGPLNYLFSAPAPHRWHHARDARSSACNFGGDVLVWDLLFGTFRLPPDREPSDDVGIPDGDAFPRTLGGVLASPFTWPRFRAPQ
jgi:sterol desaturase/sphingolipid hydroxylase (fatty acid hydroxylase superfamily)